MPPLPNFILTSIFQGVSLPVPPLTSSGLGFVRSRGVTKLKQKVTVLVLTQFPCSTKLPVVERNV